MNFRQPLRRLLLTFRSLSSQYIYPLAPGVHDLLFFRTRRLLARLNYARVRGDWQLLQAPFQVSTGINMQQPLVSVIVPTYNHVRFIDERMHTIIEQTYTNFEIIILDDASTDGTTEKVREWAARYPEKIRLEENERNSGAPFVQWGRGLELARGELIWIAESDDCCDLHFLQQLVPGFSNRSVMIGFGRTVFIEEDGRPADWNMDMYLPELGTDFWTRPLHTTAHQLVSLIWCRRNVMPNVSGLLFRAAARYPLLAESQWQQMRVCGDWWLYLCLARGGAVAYVPTALNFYRQHGANTSTSHHRSDRYFDEHLTVAEQVLKLYAVDDLACQAMQRELRDRWTTHYPQKKADQLAARLATLQPRAPFAGRLPNVLIVTYALVPGGGEIMPLRLANILHGAGYAVTVLNCAQLPAIEGVAAMLDRGIALLDLPGLAGLPALVESLGIELVHTHNTWVDTNVAQVLTAQTGVAHVITSHGMYDTLTDGELTQLRHTLAPSLAGVAYVADNNLPALARMGLSESACTRLPNALARVDHSRVSRAAFGIGERVFLLCIASRGIAEKGWREAVAAVAAARERCGEDIHLLIVGEGPERARLLQEKSPHWLHLPGFRSDAAACFAIADAGLLPSYFSGESQPLSLLECLASGRPVIATDTGEVRQMLQSPGGMAGIVVPLREGRADVAVLSQAVETYATDSARLHEDAQRAAAAVAGYSDAAVLAAHAAFYQQALADSSGPARLSIDTFQGL